MKLTLDYRLADHAHKENQTLVSGKEVPSYPHSLHPHDPFPSPREGEKSMKEKLLLAFRKLGESLSLFPQCLRLSSQGADTRQVTRRQSFAGRMVSDDSHPVQPLCRGPRGASAAQSSSPL